MTAPWSAPLPKPAIVHQAQLAASDNDRMLATLAWLSKQPVVPLDDLTARRHHCVTQTGAQGWLRDVCQLTNEAISDIGSITGIFNGIKNGIPRAPLSVQAPDEIETLLRGTDRRAGLLTKILPRGEQAAALYWGLATGVAPIQIEKLRGSPRDFGKPRATRRIKTWEPTNLQYEWGTDAWLLNTSMGLIDVERATDDEGDRLFYLWRPYSHSQPLRTAPWRYLSLMAILLRDAMFARSRHAQVLSPQRVAKFTEGYTEPQRQVLQDILESMSYNGWLILPPGTDYEISNVTGNDITQVYGNIIDFCRKEVEIGLLGTVTGVEGTTGFQGGDIGADITSAQLGCYSDSFTEFMSEIAVTPCMRDCYGDIDGVVYHHDLEPLPRKVARAEALEKFGRALVSLKAGADALGADVKASDPGVQALARGFQVSLTPKPPGTAPIAKLDLAPTDVAKAVTIDEVRSAQGLPAEGPPEGEQKLVPAPTPQGAPNA